MAQVKKSQADRAEKLQDLWLAHMEKLLENGTATSTDLATLGRVLLQNGWSLDASQLPQSLRDAIPGLPDAGDLEDDDMDVVGKIA